MSSGNDNPGVCLSAGTEPPAELTHNLLGDLLVTPFTSVDAPDFVVEVPRGCIDLLELAVHLAEIPCRANVRPGI